MPLGPGPGAPERAVAGSCAPVWARLWGRCAGEAAPVPACACVCESGCAWTLLCVCERVCLPMSGHQHVGSCMCMCVQRAAHACSSCVHVCGMFARMHVVPWFSALCVHVRVLLACVLCYCTHVCTLVCVLGTLLWVCADPCPMGRCLRACMTFSTAGDGWP